jgi:membrane AbrB-like protein
VGLQFDVEALREIGRLTAAFVISTLALIGSAALLGWLLVLLVGIDPLTAYLATTPGGLNVVAILSLESGANAPLVIAIGLLRFLAILLLGPWLVRWCISYS